MKLEDALDIMIFDYEDYRHENSPDNSGLVQAWETILRCADIEWQRREMRKEGITTISKALEDFLKIINADPNTPLYGRSLPEREGKPTEKKP